MISSHRRRAAEHTVSLPSARKPVERKERGGVARKDVTISRTGRRRRWGAVPLCALAAMCAPWPGGGAQAAEAAGAAAKRPSVVSVSRAPGLVRPGKTLRLGVTVANRTKGRTAKASLTVRLSPDGRSGAGTTKIGSARVPALRPGARRRVVVRVRLPRAVPRKRAFRLLVCAGATACRTAPGRVAALAGSSHDVIAAARAVGRLDENRAILYRLMATFRDKRLPKVYRGDGSRTDITEAFADARRRLARMPASVRRQVEPFLLPPPARRAAANRARVADFTTCKVRIADWRNVQAEGVPVRVWWPADMAYEKQAKRIAAAISTDVWPALTALMGKPKDDAHKLCSGTDGSTDIYLQPLASRADGGASQYDASCAPSPGWIVVDPGAPGGVLAHEFMHVLQFAHARSRPCERWTYLDDATATWAEDHVYPRGQSEHASAFLELLRDPLTVFGYGDGYPGWVFFKAVTAGEGSAAPVAALYAKAKDLPPLRALDAALPGGLAKQWPAFARYGWNRRLDSALKDSFFSWDALSTAPKAPRQALALPKGQDNLRRPVGVTLMGLGRQYTVWDLSDTTARRVRFADPSATGVDPGLHADAFVKTADGKWTHEDWTGVGEREYCRDQAAEDVREVVLIHSTSTLAPEQDVTKNIVRTDRPAIELEKRCGEPGRYKVLSVNFETHTEGSQDQSYCGSVSGTVDFKGQRTTEYVDEENALLPDDAGGSPTGQIAAPVPARWVSQLRGCTRPEPKFQPVACSTTREDTPRPDGTWKIGFSIEAESLDAPTAKIRWWVDSPSVGYIDSDDSVCNVGEFWNHFEREELAQTIPMSRLTSSAPVTLTFAGGPRHWGADSLGQAATLSKTWRYEITFQRIDEKEAR